MRFVNVAIVAGLALAGSCVGTPDRDTANQVRATEGQTFAQLVASLSEDGGYFDTDNLISNETSYLHALTELDQRGVSGGAYLGVGPDQNFSYIAASKPEVAIIIDIRRDNVLQHFLFKALFALSATRLEYLANLTGAALPPVEDPAWQQEAIDDLVRSIDNLTPLPDSALQALRGRIEASVRATGVELGDSDLETILRFHDEFREEGLDLRFRSHYRSPQPYYPTLRRLILERDLEGQQRSFLARDRDFQFVRAMQREDRIIPVVGDLAGPSALRNVANYLEGRGTPVQTFYTSNVEFYLFQNGSFGRFVENVRRLPRSAKAVFIRSYFNRFRATHPATVPGFMSTQLVQPFDRFLDAASEGVSYRELMFR